MSASPWRVPVGPPRRVKMSAYVTRAEAVSFLAALICFAACAATLAGFSLSDVPVWDDLRLALRGVPARGAHVGNLTTDAAVRGRPVYEVRFRFRDAEGRDHLASAVTTDDDLLARIKGSTDLEVRYDPRDPRRARLAGTRLSPYGLLVLIPALLAPAALLVAALALRSLLRRRWLYVWGEEAQGTVTLVAQRSSRFGDPPLRTHYTFQAPGGEREGMTDDVVAPPEETHVPVLYDPKRPARNVLPRPGAFDV